MRTVSGYNRYGAAEVVTESATGPVAGAPATQSRTASISYDAANRPVSQAITTGGPQVTIAAMPTSTISYDPATGRAVSLAAAGWGTVVSTIVRTHDQLGRMTRYTDADGGWTDYVFDQYGKPTQLTDSLGTSRTVTYDRSVEPRGFPTAVTDSVAGTFSASYGPDGELLEQAMPGGVVLRIGYDANRSPVSRTYLRALMRRWWRRRRSWRTPTGSGSPTPRKPRRSSTPTTGCTG